MVIFISIDIHSYQFLFSAERYLAECYIQRKRPNAPVNYAEQKRLCRNREIGVKKERIDAMQRSILLLNEELGKHGPIMLEDEINEVIEIMLDADDDVDITSMNNDDCNGNTGVEPEISNDSLAVQINPMANEIDNNATTSGVITNPTTEVIGNSSTHNGNVNSSMAGKVAEHLVSDIDPNDKRNNPIDSTNSGVERTKSNDSLGDEIQSNSLVNEGDKHSPNSKIIKNPTTNVIGKNSTLTISGNVNSSMAGETAKNPIPEIEAVNKENEANKTPIGSNVKTSDIRGRSPADFSQINPAKGVQKCSIHSTIDSCGHQQRKCQSKYCRSDFATGCIGRKRHRLYVFTAS